MSDPDLRPTDLGGPVRRQVSPWPFVAMAAFVCTLFLYGASLLVAPWWAVALLLLAWLVAFALACRWWITRPGRVIGLALVMTGIWFVTLVAGARLLGWSAEG